MTVVPHDQLSPDVLDAVIEEFITRHGAVHGHSETSISNEMAEVLRQLKSGAAIIVFDEASESCTIMSKDDFADGMAVSRRAVD